ncbi:MAG: hypothetical protein E6Q26_06130 [Acinetobacter sp.]|jgi:hypothetical protein|nr:hypothetical protein [Elizabethkingia anophelis]MDV4086342.1 hypothetical protein [Elizabethkingia anophelis]TXJ01997.1 MAG: hypothetical protein E6Q26_06130 [Acinetobacter sp.]|tara:strand:- start:64 stop:267 length:204 start_codon:yes stop_codon:yes gene_type:complete
MDKVTAEEYQQNPGRYELVSGHEEGAPTCPYGNIQQWVGYDKKTKKFIRFTKSVFKQLIAQKENEKR